MKEQDDALAYRVAYLIKGFIQQTLSTSEQEELDDWIGASDKNMLLFEELTDENVLAKAYEHLEKAPTEQQLERIQNSVQVNRPRSYFWKFAVAASLLAAMAVFFIYRYTTKEKPTHIIAAIPVNDLSPGGNKAILQLTDGSTIVLDSAQNGIISEQGKTQIIKTDSGRIAYKENPASVPFPGSAEIRYNKLTTPRGGVYFLLLQDGTKAWLNAASSIRYPVVFANNERRVEITGEVYFEVAHLGSDNPFIVDYGDAEVKVLGTHFNVNAYEDEDALKVTLLEGSVQVSNRNTRETKVIKPGQQVLLKENRLELAKAPNFNAVMGWKNGLFIFKDLGIESIMRQISRWYDVSVRYEGEKTTQLFNATISRNTPVSTLFRLLEKTKLVHFTIDGKNIIVRP